MIDLGIVKPGKTIRIPMNTFDSNDPQASATVTGLAAADVEIYKDGSTTQRASDSGYTVTTDFDTTTGVQFIAIDLADNTTAGFYAAGSEYIVVVGPFTLDAATINAAIARFEIGYPDAILNTTIATLSTQTSFTLSAGPAEDDALNGMYCIIHDVASSVQAGYAVISDYTGSTKTVTLAAGTTFTAAATDNISIIGLAPLQPTTAGNTLNVAADGDIGGNVDGSVASVTGAVGSVTGAVGSVTGAVGSVTGNVGGNVVGSVASVTGNVGGNVTGSIGSLATQAKADVNAEADTAFTDYDPPTMDELVGLFQLALRSDSAIETDRSALLTLLNANEGTGAGDYSAQTDANEALQAEHDATQTTLGTPAGASIAADIATVDSVADGIQTDLDNGTDGLGALLSAINSVMTTAMTESYSTDGSTATPAQALYLIMQMLTEANYSDTTCTVKKLDGSTTAFTLTLDSATNPTSITRAT